MGFLNKLELKPYTKANRNITYSENAFRAFLLVLIIYSIFKNKSVKMHHGSLMYHSLITMSMTFFPGTVQRLTKTIIIPAFRYFFLIFLFVSQILGEIADFYEKVFWWDKMAHLSSSILITIIGYIIVYKLSNIDKPQEKLNIKFASLFAYSFSIMVGSIWEIFEYFMDNTFGFNMQRSGLVDTMEDMIVCAVISLVVCLIYSYDIRNNKSSFVTHTIRKFLEVNKNT